VNRSKRSALRAENRDPTAAQTMLRIPPRDLHGVRRPVSLRGGFERLHLQGSKTPKGPPLASGLRRLLPGRAGARRACGCEAAGKRSGRTPAIRAAAALSPRLASAAACAAPSNPLLSESSFESSSLGAFEFGSLSSNHALSTSTSIDLDSRNCQTLRVPRPSRGFA